MEIKTLFKRIVETSRLMVGVGDYAKYCSHMQTHHPEATVLSETEYFRYCQEARFPSRAGAIKRCPC